MTRTLITFGSSAQIAGLRAGDGVQLSNLDTRRWRVWLYRIVFFGRRRPYRRVTRRIVRVLNETTVELDGD